MKKLLVTLICVLVMLIPQIGICGDKLNAKEERLKAIRNGDITAVEFLRDEIDFWGEFSRRLIETGNLVAVQYSKDKMLGGFEFSLYDTDSLNVIAGIIPIENDNAKWFIGVQYKGFPLLGDLHNIFERFDPGFVLVNGNVRFCISFVWRQEEVEERMK